MKKAGQVNILTVIAYFLIIIGCLGLFNSGVDIAITVRRIITFPRAVATVVSYKTEYKEGLEVNYPVLEYRTKDGNLEKRVVSSGATKLRYSIGDQVDALIAPDNSSRIWILSAWQLWLWSMIYAVLFGFVPLTLGVVMLKLSKRKHKAAQQ